MKCEFCSATISLGVFGDNNEYTKHLFFHLREDRNDLDYFLGRYCSCGIYIYGPSAWIAHCADFHPGQSHESIVHASLLGVKP